MKRMTIAREMEMQDAIKHAGKLQQFTYNMRSLPEAVRVFCEMLLETFCETVDPYVYEHYLQKLYYLWTLDNSDKPKTELTYAKFVEDIKPRIVRKLAEMVKI